MNSASGDYSSITGGLNNTSSGYKSFVVGGANNTASGYLSFVGAGYTNTASNAYATVISGSTNTASGFSSFIGGGGGNTASSCYSTVVGGLVNSANGARSFIGGGYLNTASGGGSTISGGYTNTASGCFSNVSGGYNNSATAPFSSVQGGSNACAYLLGMRANANVSLGIPADNQNSILFANNNPSLTSGGTSILYLDGSVATITPSGSNRSWNVFVQWNATVTSISGTATGVSVGDVKTRNDMFFYKKVGGVGSVSSITQTGVANDTSMGTSDIAYSNNAGSLQLTFVAPTFAGGGTVTFKVGATLKLTEIAW
jgi:hypothetical protein